jgi:DNA-binding transcriptional LysR family regulator
MFPAPGWLAGNRGIRMTALMDVDQLRTFIAIVETGSFTRAAEVVHKTQSAVSMQMKRLEERLDRPIFARDGRASKLTEDGERLLDYARRIVKLNIEALAAFSDAELTGRVRLGVPDDYADRYLPDIMARFSRAYPGVELTVICEPSIELGERIDANELDLAIITNCESNRPAEAFRRERLLWVTSNRHSTHTEEPLPLALGRPTCGWRRAALECLEAIDRPHRVLFSSPNAGAVSAAELAGLAISVFPESGLRPGMRVLTPAEGYPELPSCRIGLVRNPHETTALAEALAEHIVSSLDNLSETSQAAE